MRVGVEAWGVWSGGGGVYEEGVKCDVLGDEGEGACMFDTLVCYYFI